MGTGRKKEKGRVGRMKGEEKRAGRERARREGERDGRGDKRRGKEGTGGPAPLSFPPLFLEVRPLNRAKGFGGALYAPPAGSGSNSEAQSPIRSRIW